MRWFQHENVMTLIGICTDFGENPYIVMPFMANGSLLAYLMKERSNLTVAEDAGEKMVKIALLAINNDLLLLLLLLLFVCMFVFVFWS